MTQLEMLMFSATMPMPVADVAGVLRHVDHVEAVDVGDHGAAPGTLTVAPMSGCPWAS